MTDRWRVLVCGTRFGRVYMSAVADHDIGMDLVGVLASGSDRSKRCAARLGVPLYTDVDQVPDGVHAACVAIGSEVSGGPGTRIALRLLERRISVLQEHPLHHDELAALLRAARRSGAVHQLSTLYPHLRTVRRFLAASAALLRDHPPLFLDGACAVQMKTSFLDIVGRTLGKLHPWEFQALPSGRMRVEAPVPFRSVQGVIGGIPMTIRLQNEIHGSDPDNHCHMYHHLTLGTSVGSLCLVDTHGPLVWRPRPHVPRSIQADEQPTECADPALDLPTATVLSRTESTWREAMVSEWPAAVALALLELRRRARGERVMPDPQYSLSLLKMVQDLDAVVGPPEVIWTESPRPRGAEPLVQAMGAVT